MSDLDLSLDDLRQVTRYSAECASEVVEIFELARPEDPRPREAIRAARTFAQGGPRTSALREAAWAALQATEGVKPAAAEAAKAAMHAASAAYLHPVAKANQVKHILGAAGHGARAVELYCGDPEGGTEYLYEVLSRATPALVRVLKRYPAAPRRGGRVGMLIRELDRCLRSGTV